MNKEIRYHYEENRPIAGFEHLIGHMVLRGEITAQEALEELNYVYGLGERPDLPPGFRRDTNS